MRSIVVILWLFTLVAAAPARSEEGVEVTRIHFGTLKQVEWVEVAGTNDSLLGSEFRLRISDAVKSLHGTTVRIKGFMTPLDHFPGEAHAHDHSASAEAESVDGEPAYRRFLFAAMPHSGCNYCATLTPESMIEVETTQPIPFSYGAIEIFGTLRVDESDPDGIVYRLLSAARYR